MNTRESKGRTTNPPHLVRSSSTLRILLNVASVDATDESDIAALAPAGAPGVLDDPVVGAGGRVDAPTDKEHGVVDRVGGAASGSHDAAEVRVELGGIDGDGERAVGHEVLLHLGGLVGIKVVDVGDLDNGLGGAESAGGADALVGVGSLGHETAVALGPLEGSVGPATVAARVSGIAIDELLLGERDELARLDKVSTLSSTDGRESPAGTAGGLVLDSDDSTLGSPVVGGGDSTDVDSVERDGLTVGRDVEVGEELVGVLVGELGDTVGGLGIDVVVVGSDLHVLLEDLVATDLLLDRLVGLEELLLEVGPGGVVLVGEAKSSAGHQSKDSNNSLHFLYEVSREKIK